MPSRDLTSDLKTLDAIGPAPDPSGGINGDTIDTLGYEAVTLVAMSEGGDASGDYSFKAQSAPDDGTGSPGTWVDVAAADLRGSFSANFTADTDVHNEVGVITKNRFVRLVLVEDTAATTTDPTTAGVAILGKAVVTPAA